MVKKNKAEEHEGTRKHKPCALVICALLLCSWPVRLFAEADSALGAQGQTERISSPYIGQRFYEIAYETANSKRVSAHEVEEAIIFLAAAANLDSRADYVLPEMIELASQDPKREHSKQVAYLLEKYVKEAADLEVIRKAISYLVGRLDSREEREKTLEVLLGNFGRRNKLLGSELATSLGLLMAEKTDLEAAQFYLMQAYNSNKYNKVAFAKLAELIPDRIGPAIYLEHLRLGLRENPLKMEAALAFAQYAERLQLYETAADAYEYCADLFRFLYPSEMLPASIYLPWAISSYNTERSQHKCLQIASELRESDYFDLLLEALAGKAAAKLGYEQRANRILQTAEGRALRLVIDDPQLEDHQPRTGGYEQLAWFYCFASPDANKALEWANKTYSTEPNSADAAAILAYSLVMHGQTEWAKSLVDNYEQTQIAALTLAQIQLAKKQHSSAIETLRSAISKDPGSLAAERAKEILAEQGSEYIAPIDPNIILTVLKDSFGEAFVPAFVSPEKIISFRLNLQGSEFYYGSEFGATVTVTNGSTEPLIISDDGLFRGNIRVDASVRGDIEREIPNLVSTKVRPALPIEPGRSIIIPVRLVTGALRQILRGYPQASLVVEFTVYLDPVATADGELSNALTWIKPARASVKRLGVELSSRYLQNRLESLSKGQQGQKIRTAQLFTGLLMEQHFMANHGTLYDKFKYADWMPALLKSALVQAITDDDWTVKVHTMAGMVSLPLDYELISALAENLNDARWPVRFMTVFLLAKSQGDDFHKVLDSTAKYDSNEYVRQMAIALGGEKPQPQSQRQPDSAMPERTAVEPVNRPALGNSTLRP